MADVSMSHLKSVLHYDAQTGVFTYVKNRRHRKSGDVAGYVSEHSLHCGGGYRIIPLRHGVFRKEYAAHRLAWFYHYGKFPKNQVDHINGVRDDNRIVNLREATCSQNCANRVAQSNNTSGMKGVSYHKAGAKWRADIQVDGKPLFLGLYKTTSAAESAYNLAAYLYFGEFSRASREPFSV